MSMTAIIAALRQAQKKNDFQNAGMIQFNNFMNRATPAKPEEKNETSETTEETSETTEETTAESKEDAQGDADGEAQGDAQGVTTGAEEGETGIEPPNEENAPKPPVDANGATDEKPRRGRPRKNG